MDCDLELCALHNLAVNLFCKDCEIYICLQCINGDHLLHNYEHGRAKAHREFQQSFQHTSLSTVYRDLLEKFRILQDMQSEAESLRSSIASSSATVDTCYQHTLACMRSGTDFKEMAENPKLLDEEMAKSFLLATQLTKSAFDPMKDHIGNLNLLLADLTGEREPVSNSDSLEVIETKSKENLESSDDKSDTASYISSTHQNNPDYLIQMATMDFKDAKSYKNELHLAEARPRSNQLYVLTYFHELYCYDIVKHPFVKIAALTAEKVTNIALIQDDLKKVAVVTGRSQKVSRQSLKILTWNLSVLQTLNADDVTNDTPWVVASQGHRCILFDGRLCHAYDTNTGQKFAKYVLPVVGALTKFVSFQNQMTVISKNDAILGTEISVIGSRKNASALSILSTTKNPRSENFASAFLPMVGRRLCIVVHCCAEFDDVVIVKVLNVKRVLRLRFEKSVAPIAVLGESRMLLQDLHNRNQLIIAQSERMANFFLECAQHRY